MQRANEPHADRSLILTRRSLLLALPVLPAALSTQRLDFASEADRLTDLTQKTFWEVLAGVLGSVCVLALFGAVLTVLARTETAELLGRMRREPR